MNYFRRLWEDYKAYRRGERRVAPKNVRGRIYARAASTSGGTQIGATPKASLEITITRADGSVEKQIVPSEVINHG